MLRIVIAAVLVLSLIPVAGASYEALASAHDAARYPARGAFFDVDGHRVHLFCIGEGSPTVILDAGLGGSSRDWALIQPELGGTTRTCAYDRPGMGWSEAAPSRRTPDQIATELALLLERANIDGPYVLVAHSLAGKNARRFAMRHRGDVVGMVLIDARHEYVDQHTTTRENRAFVAAVDGQTLQYAITRRLGVARLLGVHLAGAPLMAPRLRQELAVIGTRAVALAATADEARNRAASDDLLRGAPPLGELPLVALAAGQNMAEPRWAEGQRRLAALSSNGRLVVARGSSHAVHWDDPSLVIEVVREVIAEARLGR